MDASELPSASEQVKNLARGSETMAIIVSEPVLEPMESIVSALVPEPIIVSASGPVKNVNPTSEPMQNVTAPTPVIVSAPKTIQNIVLVGRTGNGKSATGNSIIGKQVFLSESKATGVTMTCQTYKTETPDGSVINVIDTPGLFDLLESAEYISKEIINCMKLAAGGIHVVVLVISLRTRITLEEQNTLSTLQSLFGSEIMSYLIVLFTGGDELEANNTTLDNYLSRGCPDFLKVSAEFISKEIVRCLELAEEGLHAVVLVISLRNRISKEEEDTLCTLQVLFGSKILDYLIIVFTGGDELESNNQQPESLQSKKKAILDKTPEQLLENYFSNGCPEFLTNVFRLCGNRKVVFNNRSANEIQKEKQVQRLLDNVAAVEKVNGGRPFKDGIHLKVQTATLMHMNETRVLEAMHLARADIADMKQQLEIKHQNNLLQIAQMVENIIRRQIQQNTKSCNIL